jgi:glycyl-tRNA synthetase beta chain
MAELFIEIGAEEIPVAEIGPAIEHLSNTLSGLFKNDGIDFGSCTTYATPRRLAVCFQGLSDKGKSEVITYTGPRKEAAFDKDGNPTQAAMGFARSKGVDVKSLKVVRLDKGEFVQAEIKKPGIQTKALIKQNLERIVLNTPFRKSMKWGGIENSSNGSNSLNRSSEKNSLSGGNGSIRFIRPIRWLIILYKGKVVPIVIGNVKASSYTYGLRTGSVKEIKVSGSDSWLKAMDREKILPDVEKRKKSIMGQAEEMAKKVKGRAQHDIELLDTITNLVESPVAITGSFDQRFMNLPKEVIMSVMKTQQKYIPVVDEKLALMPYFIGISNNPYGDKTVIRKGYERVLRARLEDAEFYYHQDIKQPLEAYMELLKGMVYNPVLGSLYDKTQRIVAIASFLCDEIKVGEALKVVTLEAARLCKADLATRLVSEFPELQGIIGRHYIQDAKLKTQDSESETHQIAAAVYEHSSKEIPQTLPGAVVSIADKIDTVAGFFSIGEVPTGTQDPYGLRRAAIGIINVILEKGAGFNIKELVSKAVGQYKHITDSNTIQKQILDYIYGRFEGILKERYYKKLKIQDSEIDKLINAVIATEPDNILEAEQRVDALKDIVFEPGFEPMQLAFKRVINISKKHVAGDINGELLAEPSEKALYNSYLKLKPEIQLALAKGNYIGYINLIQNLVEPINTFFDKVLVMSDNENIKNNRLNMLAKIKNLVMQVLDITKLI